MTQEKRAQQMRMEEAEKKATEAAMAKKATEAAMANLSSRTINGANGATVTLLYDGSGIDQAATWLVSGSSRQTNTLVL